MPTSYTATLLSPEEASFEAFIWRCAHAFLPIGRMGGNTAAMPLRFVAGGQYYREAITSAKNRLAELEALTDAAFAAQAPPILDGLTLAEAAQRDHAIFRTMYARVIAWRPPPTYQSLRDFMKDQLTLELADDPPSGTLPLPPVPDRMQAIAAEQDVIGYAEQRLAQLEAQATTLTHWIEGLTQLVGAPPKIAPPFKLE